MNKFSFPKTEINLRLTPRAKTLLSFFAHQNLFFRRHLLRGNSGLITAVLLLLSSAAMATDVAGFVYCYNGSIQSRSGIVIKAYRLDGTYMSQTTTNGDGYYKFVPAGAYDGLRVQLRITYQGTTTTKTITIPATSIDWSIDCCPTISPQVNSETICQGESTVLTVTNCAGTVTWFTPGQSNPRTVSPSTTTTYTAYCTVNDCVGSVQTTVTVNPKPTPSVSSATICDGESATLSVSNCGGSILWNTGATSSSITVNPNSTTNYTATCTVGGCQGTATGTVTVNPKPNPSIVSVRETVICQGNSATLSVLNCAGSVQWSTGETSSSITISPSSTTTYTVTCTVGNCQGSASGTIIVNPNPNPSVSSATICLGQSATLSVSNCGGSILWNTGATSSSITVNPNTTTNYSATCTVGSCQGAASGIVTVNPNPNPSVSSATICVGQSATLSVSNCGGSILWNTGATSSSITVNPNTTTNYTATCTVGSCQGAASGTVTVNPNPNPSVNNAAICAGESATLTVSNCGGSVSWNTGATSSSITVNPNTTTNYTATCTVGTCKGTASGTVTVNPNPNPSVNNAAICAGESATLTVSNCSGSVSWNTGATTSAITVSPATTTTYTATCTVGTCKGTATGTVTVNPKPTLSITSTVCSTDLTTYTVTFTSNGTVSTDKGTVSGTTVTGIPAGQTVTLTADLNGCKATATATKNCNCPTINPPVGTSKTICAGDVIPALTVTVDAGLQADWYATATSTTKLASGLSYTPTAAGDFYVEAINPTSGCKSATRTKVSLVVNPKPILSITSTVCSTDLTTYTVTFTSNGTVSTDKGTVSGSTVTGIPAGQTVTLTADLNGCKATATATKNCNCPTINPPVGTSKTICAGEAIPALTVTVDAGLQADWYATATSTTKLASGLSYTPTVGGDFYVEAINPTSGCKSATRTKVSLIVNPKPTLSITSTVCSTDLTTYTVTFTSNGTVSADKGTVSGTTVTGIPAGQTVTLTADLNGCKATATATKNCNCPTINPPVGTSKTICAGEAIPALTVTVDAGLQADWYATATSTTKLASGLSYTPTAAGDFYVEAINPTSGCKSATRIKVSLIINPKPTLSTQATCAINGLTYNITVTTNAASITADKGTVTGTTVTGVPSGQTVTITATSANGCKATTTVTQNCTTPKGSIGDYVWKDANNDGIQDATELPVKGVIVQLLQGTTILATDTTDAAGLYLFPNLSSGSYQVKILTTSLPAGCTLSTQQNKGTDDAKDSDFDPTTGLSQTVTINALGTGIAKDNLTVDGALYSPKGSIGDYVWKDANNDGIQQSTEAAVKGVIVQLLQGVTVIATDTTDAAGLYLFPNLSSGNYQVKILTASFPVGCTLSKQTNKGNDDTKDSDFDPNTGLSPVITINTAGTGINKDNPTIDAALVVPCIKPNAGPDQNLTCALIGAGTADLENAASGQKWKALSVQAGTTVTVTTPAGAVSGMVVPGLYQFVLQTQTDSLACRDTVNVFVPECTCPSVNVLTPNTTVCKGSTFSSLSVAIIGSNTAGIGAAWYANAVGGSVLGTGVTFTPTGLASQTDTFYVELTGVSDNCLKTPRTPVIVKVQDCSVLVDLALKKSINKKIAQIGDVLTYTLKVWNESNTNATKVSVTDSIASTVQFVNASFVPSRGTATITGNVIQWIIGNIAANGDTVTLTYQIKATQEGVHFNTAEICQTNEKDVDSTPCNHDDEEDDIDRQCFSVAYKLCPTEQVEVNVPAYLTNVQWFKNGSRTPVASGNKVLLSDIGSYTFTATNQTCPTGGCCPVIIEPGNNCCPVDLCIPFRVKKTKGK